MRSWVFLGLPPSDIWSLCLREIEAIMRGAEDRRRAEHDGRAWLAWHTAHLPQNPKIKFSELLTPGGRKPAKVKTWEDEFAAFAAWAESKAARNV